MKKVIINNSKDAAIKNSKWSNPGAKLYDDLLDAFYYEDVDNDNVDETINNPNNLYWTHYLQEAYLIAPIKQIKNSPYGRTPYSRSGCKYPHHTIKSGELILDVNGVRSAYIRARQMGVLKGDVEKHIMAHIKELGLEEDLHIKDDIKMEENFQFVESFIENLDNEYFDEASHGNLNNSFRLGIDIKNGHRIKIIFDLNRDDVIQIGSKQWNTDGTLEDRIINNPKQKQKIISEIKKTGYNDFISRATILTILDMDTNSKLKTVEMIGAMNSFLMDTTVIIGEDIINQWRLYFNRVPKPPFYVKFWQNTMELRELIASSFAWKQKLPNSDVKKFNVGEKDDINGSFKSTKMTKDVWGFMNNVVNQTRSSNTRARGVKIDNLKETVIPGEIEYRNKNSKNESFNCPLINENFNYIETFIESSRSIEEDEFINEGYIFSENNLEIDLDQRDNIINKSELIGEGASINNESNLEELVPIFGLAKNYIVTSTRSDGTPIPTSSSQRFSKIIKKLTRGDNYSHALISMDDTFKNMYSFEDDGFVTDNLWTREGWDYTGSIYITVMFVTLSDKAKMETLINKLTEEKEETEYANINLIKAFIGKPIKNDKRFVCSSFTGYILSLADSKNLHRDYSRLRPEDVTILPRAFYVMNVENREDFIKQYNEILSRVKNIYEEHKEELSDYNNHLPKLLLKNKMGELKTLDKIMDWIINKM